ncbi:MAG: hypothetical protein Q9170_008154 [Blastenia crenularia]
MKSMANGRIIAPRIKKKAQLASSDSHAHPKGREKPSATPDFPSQSTNGVTQASTNGHGSPPPLGRGTAALLEGQRKDIDRIMANVENLVQDMKAIKASMEYLKFQQKTFETFADHEVDPSQTTRNQDIHVLTERVHDVSTKANRVDTLTEDLNVLNTKVAKVSTGVTEIDGLKLELKLMKRRIKRLEKASTQSQESNLTSMSSTTIRPDVQRNSEPVPNDAGISQEIPSSTANRSQSEHAPANLQRNDSTMSLGENRLVYVSDSGPDQFQGQSQYFDDRDMTPENNLVQLLQPQITSAEKVAAYKRRRSESSSPSSSQSTPLSTPNRPLDRPRIHTKPDWTTKPNPTPRTKGKITSLNDAEHVLTSDPEDSDYDPNSLPQAPTALYNMKDISKSRSKPPLRLPTPEWEKPDWEGPSSASFTNSNTRGTTTARRGVSGRGFVSDRSNTFRRSSSGYANGDYAHAQSSDYWDEEPSSRRHSGTSDTNSYYAKRRDSKGRLLRSDGRVDGRSIRQQCLRAARAKVAAAREEVGAQKLDPIGQNQAPVPVSKESYVDAAALAAARYGSVGKPVAQQMSGAMLSLGLDQAAAQTEVKQEVCGVDPKAQGIGGAPQVTDAHAKIMKQMFPWR